MLKNLKKIKSSIKNRFSSLCKMLLYISSDLSTKKNMIINLIFDNKYQIGSFIGIILFKFLSSNPILFLQYLSNIAIFILIRYIMLLWYTRVIPGIIHNIFKKLNIDLGKYNKFVIYLFVILTKIFIFLYGGLSGLIYLTVFDVKYINFNIYNDTGMNILPSSSSSVVPSTERGNSIAPSSNRTSSIAPSRGGLSTGNTTTVYKFTPREHRTIIESNLNEGFKAVDTFSDLMKLDSNSKKVPLTFLDAYENSNSFVHTIFIDHNKVRSIYIPEINKYYDPDHSIWFVEETKEWLESCILYGKNENKITYFPELKLKRSGVDSLTTYFLNKGINPLFFDDTIKKDLREINHWNLHHINMYDSIQYPLVDLYQISPENYTEYLLSINEVYLKAAYMKLYAVHRPDWLFASVAEKLMVIVNNPYLDEATRHNVRLFVQQLYAQRTQLRVLSDDIGQRCLLLKNKYPWIAHSEIVIEENKKNIRIKIPPLNR